MKAFFESNDNQVNLIEDKDIESSDNYIKFPDGTLICRGYSKMKTLGESKKHINFPIEFINESYCVSIQNVFSYNSEILYSFSGISKTGFDVYSSRKVDESVKEIYFCYIAIGKWK